MSQANPELQALSQTMMEIEGRLEALHGELQNLQILKEDVEMAISTIESISTGATIQVPLVSETYIRAAVASEDDFIIGIGGGYSKVSNKEKVRSLLEERIETLVDRMEKISEAIDGLKTQGEKLSQQAQEQLSKLQ